MLSRVADTLYWMSRYLERASMSARNIDVQLENILDHVGGEVGSIWTRLLTSLRVPTPHPDPLNAETVTALLTYDPKNPASIARLVECARENARQARDRVSSEMWEHINKLYLQIKLSRLDSAVQSQPHDFFQSVIEGARLFQGIADCTLCQDEGWQFIQIGRYLERAGNITSLLDAHAPVFTIPAIRTQQDLICILHSCSAFEAYCKVYTADPRADRIVEFLLLSPEFPHSVRFAIDTIHRSIQRLSSHNANVRSKTSRVERLTGRLSSSLGFVQTEEIFAGGLRPFLDDIMRQCNLIHTAIHQQYISYTVESALA